MVLDWLCSFRLERKTRQILSLSGLFCDSALNTSSKVFYRAAYLLSIFGEYVINKLFRLLFEVRVCTSIPQSMEPGSNRALLEAQRSVNGANTRLASGIPDQIR